MQCFKYSNISIKRTEKSTALPLLGNNNALPTITFWRYLVIKHETHLMMPDEKRITNVATIYPIQWGTYMSAPNDNSSNSC